MSSVYLHVEQVETKWIEWLGYILTWGTIPVHCRLYWENNGKIYMSELTNDAPAIGTETVGKGDGYTIQITPVDAVMGDLLQDVDIQTMEKKIKEYASTKNGELIYSNDEIDYFNEPRGYGGPMYDNRFTSNTFIYWVLLNSTDKVPSKPKGAIGWGNSPKFPGPAITFSNLRWGN